LLLANHDLDFEEFLAALPATVDDPAILEERSAIAGNDRLSALIRAASWR